jgi:homocysteine S-methyltransferase
VSLLQPFFDRTGFVVLDGGLATGMESRGADLDHELWSAKMLIEAPELIRSVHSDFLAAGADIIATATYQASIDGFGRAGYGKEQAMSLIRLAVDLALLARETFWADFRQREGRIRPLLAASIGPYGACLHDGSEYHGNYGVGRQALVDFHRSRLEILADTAVDLFAFETIPSRLEAEVLIGLLEDFPEKQALLSFSCRDAQSVSHGEPFSECAALADECAQVVGVGVNCTSPACISGLLECAADIETPLMVYPNSGEEWHADTQQWGGEVCDAFPVSEWFSKGARIIGGCCRTTADDIRRIRSQLVMEKRFTG